MNRETLERNRIYFEENVDRNMKEFLPPHVQSLRNAILDFDCTIFDRLSCETDEHLESIERDGFPDVIIARECLRLSKTLKECSTASDEARRLSEGEDREAEWVDHFGKWFFDPLYEASTIKDEDSRRYVFYGDVATTRLKALLLTRTRVARSKFYYDFFEKYDSRRLFGAIY
jgi:hypothetical protein